MAGGTFGGDRSVNWVIDVDNARPDTVKSNPKGSKGHSQEGIDETDPGDFTIRIRVPKTATAQTALVAALQSAAQDAARGVIKVSFKLPIESETYDQIQVEWDSKSAQRI